MDNEDKHAELYQERIVKVETQVSYLIAGHSDLKSVQDKQNTIIEALARQADNQVHVAKAITDRTDAHTKEIESLQSGQVDTGKILVGLSGQVNRLESLVKLVGGPIVGVILTYLFSQFVK